MNKPTPNTAPSSRAEGYANMVKSEVETLAEEFQLLEDKLDIDSEADGINLDNQEWLRGYSEGVMHCKDRLKAFLSRAPVT